MPGRTRSTTATARTTDRHMDREDFTRNGQTYDVIMDNLLGDEADRWAERPRPTERRADDGIGAATPTSIACDHRYLGGAPGRARVTVNPNPNGAPTLTSPSPSPGSCCTELTPLDQHCDACRDSGSSPKFDYRPTPQTDAEKPDIWVTPAL